MPYEMPQKIVLKSTTNVTLNDRFTILTRLSQSVSLHSPQVQQVRLRMASLNQLSTKAKRDAIQMANRSLSLGDGDQMMIEKQNVKARLGQISAVARLGPVRGRGGRSFFSGVPPMRGRRGIGSGYNGNYSYNQFVSPMYRTYPSRGGLGNNQYYAAAGNPGRGGFGRFNGGRSFSRGRGRGRGRGRASFHMLDTQLDQYMAKTPARLNADLDQYMAD